VPEHPFRTRIIKFSRAIIPPDVFTRSGVPSADLRKYKNARICVLLRFDMKEKKRVKIKTSPLFP